MSGLLALAVRKLAEGDFGKTSAAIYWKLKGKKAWTGIILGTLAGGLTLASQAGVCPDCGHYAEIVGKVAAFLLAIGLYDGALHEPAPIKPADNIVDFPR